MTVVLLGLILVLFCAVGVAAFTASLGHRQSVLVVVRPVSAGSVIGDADLGEARLPSDPSLRTVPASARGRVVGRVAAVNLVPGTLLADGELATGPLVDSAHAVVGLALKPGELPSGLQPQDTVTVVETPPASSQEPLDGAVLVDQAEVTSIAMAADGQTTIVSILVPRPVAPAVAGAAAKDQVTLVLIGGAPSGTAPLGGTG